MAALFVTAFVVLTTFTHVITQDTNSTLCRFEPLNPNLADKVSGYLAESGVKLIRYNVAFLNYTDNVMLEAGGDLFRPNQWIRTVNRQGMNLLMFDDNFELLSLGLLKIGLYDVDLQLVDNPRGCIHTLDSAQRMYQMRSLLLSDLKNTTQGVEDRDLYERICNKRVFVSGKHALSGQRGAQFAYTCCHGNQITCEDIQEDTWISILNYILGVVIIWILLYCPKLFSVIIDNRETEETIVYTGRLDEKCTVIVEKDQSDYFITTGQTKLSLQGMAKANRFLSTLGDTASVECLISDIKISVPRARLLPNGCYPVSIFRVFYDGIFHCGMGTSASLKPCCMSDVCCKWCTVCKCKWLSLLSIFARILLLLIFSTPFLTYYVVYYNYIRPTFDEESEACKRLDAVCLMGVDLLGLTDLSLTSLAICIVIAAVSGIVSEYVIGRCLTKTAIFSTLLIKSQKEYRIFPIVKVLLGAFVAPFKDYGILGCLVFPIYIPKIIFFVIYAILGIFPLMKLIFGCLLFFVTSEHRQSQRKKPTWRFLLESAMAIIFYYIFLASMMVLITCCITFYTEILFYTFIGVIASVNTILPFVTMLLPLGVYTRQILGKVGEMYMKYLTLLNQIVFSRYVSDSGQFGEQPIPNHEGNVLFVQSFSNQRSTDIVKHLQDSDRRNKHLSIDCNMLLIFLEYDKDIDASVSKDAEKAAKSESAHRRKWLKQFIPSKDKFEENITKPNNSTGKYYIYTPAELFFHVVSQDLPGSPGLISSSIIQAFVRLFYVVGFLGFVVVAVMGLGSTYKITLTDQLMLTVVGGVIPLIFRYGLFNYRLSSIDWDNEELKLNVIKAIGQFSEKWEVVDMTLCTSETIGPGDVRVDVEDDENTDDLNTVTDNNVQIGQESPDGEVCIPMTEVGPSTALTN